MTSDPSRPEPHASRMIRLAGLPRRKPFRFEILPDSRLIADLQAMMDLRGLRKVRFAGELQPVGAEDWALAATLGATVVQDCVITGAPVTTRIDDAVNRRYVADPAPVAPGETEMPEDADADPLPAVLDLQAVMAEALALALPDWPRAPGATFDSPDPDDGADRAANPFAILAQIKPPERE